MEVVAALIGAMARAPMKRASYKPRRAWAVISS
jgi:hypothetical protein